jgi:acyl-CoA synthetase (AMP-forming)/AMP-acid ligase II
VLLATRDQLTAALALIELDGIVGRIVLCPPDLGPEHLSSVLSTAEVDSIVSDQPATIARSLGIERVIGCAPWIGCADPERSCKHRTEWLLLTSGTTGPPKLVLHTLASLTGAIKPAGTSGTPVVWSTFYDIRRYGGLQILLRALLGGRSMVLSSSAEAIEDFLVRAGGRGVTHISGTPSHWRRALMSIAAHRIAPHYIRLSGEIADQAILDRLRTFYPEAKIAHAFASTEAGVAFDVGDGLSGFPAEVLALRDAGVEMKIEGGSLHIRSARTATRYLGARDQGLSDANGFVDTHDLVELRGDRYHFVGRRGGIINVGGLKVHPEEVEAVINRHPGVHMSLAKARKNPITGSVVVADVVVKPGSGSEDAGAAAEALRDEILDTCRHALAGYKIPATIRFVSALNIGPAGKLARPVSG